MNIKTCIGNLSQYKTYLEKKLFSYATASDGKGDFYVF